MLANLRLPHPFDALAQLVTLALTGSLSHVDRDWRDASVASGDEPPGRPGHAVGDTVGVALYHATLAGARPWGC